LKAQVTHVVVGVAVAVRVVVEVERDVGLARAARAMRAARAAVARAQAALFEPARLSCLFDTCEVGFA